MHHNRRAPESPDSEKELHVLPTDSDEECSHVRDQEQPDCLNPLPKPKIQRIGLGQGTNALQSPIQSLPPISQPPDVAVEGLNAPSVKKQAWSEEDDKQLIKLHQELGNRWAEISRFMPGRTDDAIKKRWNRTIRRRDPSEEESEAAASVLSIIPASKRKRRVTCPLCNQEGHQAKTCHQHKPLPPDVLELPYEQRKHAILHSASVPSVIELARPAQQGAVPMSACELQLLLLKLNKNTGGLGHVTHLNLSNNSMESVKFRLGAPLTKLIALKELNLSCKP